MYFIRKLSSETETKIGLFDMSATLPKPVVHKTTSASTGRRPKKKARFGVAAGYWATIKRRFGTVSSPSLSSSELPASSADHQSNGPSDEAAGEDRVDRIVVDRMWTSDSRSRPSLHEDGDNKSPETKSSYNATPLTPFQEGWKPTGFLQRRVPSVFWSMWAMFMHFFNPAFPDDRAERHYNREDWSFTKPLARWSACWLVLSWVLACALASKPRVLMDEIFLYGIAAVFSVPVIFMVAFDWPRDHSLPYQVFVGFSLWMWGFYYILSMWLCGFYQNHSLWPCYSKDFIGMFYYTTALQVVGLFGLKLQRLPAAIGSLAFFILTCITIVPLHTAFVRTMINFFLFNAFIIYAHYMNEISARRLHTLRNQLKIQFKATQRAQINERKASDSKRRLTSYVFHEVRVPLNSALLAVQNINSSGIVTKDHEIEFNALSGSLNMMRNVLNDVLDFNRMDSGTFEVSSRPFAFHTTMRSLFVPLQLATDSRGQDFVAHLDPNIDRVARRAAYQAMGEAPDVIRQHMKEHPEIAGVVTGDHVRLRQIVTNLASNATKFTPAGGRITISTKLIHPTPDEITYSEGPSTPATESVPPVDVVPSPSKRGHGHALSASHLSQHNLANGVNPVGELKSIVVRIEVTDTGYGITRRDMDECNLFSAFNQTEQGKQQGGKGTGLGLALVRQIVKLSGGRLGVRSKAGEGSCFWIELPLGVGREALVPPDMESDHSSTDPDLTKVRVAARTSADIPVSSHSLTKAVDTVAFKASQIVPPPERSNSAIHNIMEQGGRVELGLPKSTETLNAASIGSYTPTPLGSPIPPPSRPPLLEEASSSSTVPGTPVRPAVQQRPMYLPMPSPTRFARDTYPTNSTNSGMSMSSSSTSSPLAMFDANFKGIPTSNSNSSLVFEPGMSVLVVDDDLVTRKLMQRMLMRLGCTVETAENGQAALMALGAMATPASEGSGSNLGPILERPDAAYSEEKYDVVFLDNQMPILSGINAVAKLREWGRRDFVCGVTGNALLEDQEEYIAAGVDHVLTKPVNEQALRRMLVLADARRKSKALARAS
ncbi:hypothetical protein FB451DRAFT_1216444 [Mycena latifolia]|nr:hypothetical protein FB451DRAFT_1216444 [Mycena latifolia]